VKRRRAMVRAIVDLARTFAIAVPPLLLLSWAVVHGGALPGKVGLTVVILISLALAQNTRSVRRRRLSTMSSVLAAFREGDFSVRARETGEDAAVDDVLAELSALGDTLREHRLGEMEAWSLLRKVMSEIDVVVLAFDDHGGVRLANDAATRALSESSAPLVGKSATDLGLADLLLGDAPRVVNDCAALGPHAWELRRGTFRLSGVSHALLVLSDVSVALRAREREAWKRLISVMGHEINNSLAPIESIAQNLSKLVARRPLPDDWQEDVTGGLAVVGRRAEALGRFMASYARLAKLPPPVLRATSVAEWVRRVVALDHGGLVRMTEGPPCTVSADPDQLDALLINLVKNGVEALQGAKGEVCVTWTVADEKVRVVVRDDGAGVTEATSLFVPFFTTKPGGSGIGLALVRQIAEAHGGEVSLRTRDDGAGAEATVVLARTKEPTPEAS